VAAGELAAAGKDIVVLERELLRRRGFDGAELAGFQRLYVRRILRDTGSECGILAGECLAGERW